MNTVIQSLFMTNSFVVKTFDFNLGLKPNHSKVDKEDYEFGVKLLAKLKYQLVKMLVTQQPHVDIIDLLNLYPDEYRNGEQQDVMETCLAVLDKLGGFEQSLVRDVFAGELTEHTRCGACGTIKSRPETFLHLVLSVPPEATVMQTRMVPSVQSLLNKRLEQEVMSEDNQLFCEPCQHKRDHLKWCEIASPPAHLCMLLSRFVFNLEKGDFTKEKTPLQIDGVIQIQSAIGPLAYELYMVIVHTGQTATSGHYYAIGCRSESSKRDWFQMDDSQIKQVDFSLISELSTEGKKKDDSPYVLFYRCQQAPPSPTLVLPPEVVAQVRKDDEAQR